MKLTALQQAEVESALDSMAAALKEHGLLKHPVSGKYLRAIRVMRDVPPGFRRVRRDFEDQRRSPHPGMEFE